MFFLRLIFFFFNDTAPTEIYTLSLHDALPIFTAYPDIDGLWYRSSMDGGAPAVCLWEPARSEEHTSELQSQSNLVCRLLLEKKKKKHTSTPHSNERMTARLSFASSAATYPSTD